MSSIARRDTQKRSIAVLMFMEIAAVLFDGHMESQGSREEIRLVVSDMFNWSMLKINCAVPANSQKP